MKKRLMKIETNSSTMFVTYDVEEKRVMVLDNEETNDPDFDIRNVEDDSSWDMYENVDDIETWLGIDYNSPDANRIIDEIEFE